MRSGFARYILVGIAILFMIQDMLSIEVLRCGPGFKVVPIGVPVKRL